MTSLDQSQLDQPARALVLSSLEQFSETVSDPGSVVYGRLLKGRPDREALFFRDRKGFVRGEMLAQAVTCLMNLAEGQPGADHFLLAERVNHDDLGVPAEEFTDFLLAIRDAVAESQGAAWNDDLARAWDHLLRIAKAAALGS